MKKRAFPVHPVSAVLLSLGIAGAVLLLFYSLFPAFADFWNDTAGGAIRLLLAKISNVIPFSLMEFLLYSSPISVGLCAYFAIKCARGGGVYIIRAVSAVLSVAAGVYFLFCAGFASGYHGTTLDERLDLSKTDVSADELYHTALTVIDGLEKEAKSVEFGFDGASEMPFTIKELSQHHSAAYRKLSEEKGCVQGFSSDVKPLIISPLMTYTHISGIYSFFTGEANLNTNYPDFVNVFTAAHEMAHQRGISREDEANFTAFLICLQSEESYIRYCAYLNMYSYLSDALYSADRELWEDAQGRLSPSVRGELLAYSRFFDKYRDSTASHLSDTLNDAYLESQGTEGVKSYGMVVDLAVAYYRDAVSAH